MKIVVLDAYTLNPGDLSWETLSGLGEVTLHDRTPADLIATRCAGADIVLTNKIPMNAAVIESLPDLKYIGVMATGYNIIDLAAAQSRGIIVTNVPGYSTASVVQLTFALLLELCLHVQRHSDSAMGGKWAASKDFSYQDFPLTELDGKTFGIIGFGTIGKKVAAVASAFGMKVLVHSRSRPSEAELGGARWVDLDELFTLSDAVSIHCPLTPQTSGLINKDRLAGMKPSAFLLNTSRGPVINEPDLADALNNGVIAGAGLDVLSVEPPQADNPLFRAPNCIITPHIAWATRESRQRLLEAVTGNIAAFQAGKPVNTVN